MESAPQSDSSATFNWVFGLTVADLIAVYLPLGRPVIVAMLIGLAVAKSALVATYFARWRLNRKAIGLVALAPPAAVLLIASLLRAEITWRVWIH